MTVAHPIFEVKIFLDYDSDSCFVDYWVLADTDVLAREKAAKLYKKQYDEGDPIAYCQVSYVGSLDAL